MTVTYKEYNKDKNAFFKKHGCDFLVHTSCLDEYDGYHKEYSFSDGSIWYEVMSVEYVTVPVEVKLVNMEFTAKMFRIEYFSSDNAGSKYYYEKY